MAEAAGVVLAVVPICVGVVEKYTDVARVLQRFRKYSEEALYVAQAVNIQRSIYRNTIRILLTDIVTEDEAQEMLSDPSHPGWDEAHVDQKIGERLGDSRDAFIDAASAVKMKLAMLESFGHECRSQVSQLEDERRAARANKNSIRARVKFAFSQSEIELLITTVSRLTQEMQTLIQQTEVTRSSVSQPTTATRRNIAKYNTIKGAAGSLYQALSRACTVHTEHQARLGLQAVHSVPSQIRFTIAISNRRSNTNLVSPVDETGFWLTVESIVSEGLLASASLQVVHEAGKPLKRRRDEEVTTNLADIAMPNRSKTAKTKGKLQSVEPAPTAAHPVMQDEHQNSLPNFCAQENFCNQLQRLAKQPQKDPSTCVGYLELSDSSKHVVYLKSASDVAISSVASSSATFHTTALTDLFQAGYQAKLPYDGLPPQDRVRIAKQLAMAVLQFQATPWLEKPWSSKEVSMLKASNDPTTATDTDDNDLFLNVSIRKSLENSTRQIQSSNRTLIRNQLLFNLGVMMLELAFQKPLIELREVRDIDRNQDLNTDYHTADRVRRQASARLGSKYAEAARKCIHCDFGSDNDLNEVRLQESFYQNVICELEGLEKTFRDFNLSIERPDRN